MPFTWVPPTKAIEVDGKVIYHTYKENMLEGPIVERIYTTDESEDPAYSFNIDEVDIPLDSPIDEIAAELGEDKAILTIGVKLGLIKFPPLEASGKITLTCFACGEVKTFESEEGAFMDGWDHCNNNGKYADFCGDCPSGAFTTGNLEFYKTWKKPTK